MLPHVHVSSSNPTRGHVLQSTEWHKSSHLNRNSFKRQSSSTGWVTGQILMQLKEAYNFFYEKWTKWLKLLKSWHCFKFLKCMFRFGLVNAINTYIRIKKLRWLWRKFLISNAYLLNLSYQLWIIFTFVHQKSLKWDFEY